MAQTPSKQDLLKKIREARQQQQTGSTTQVPEVTATPQKKVNPLTKYLPQTDGKSNQGSSYVPLVSKQAANVPEETVQVAQPKPDKSFIDNIKDGWDAGLPTMLGNTAQGIAEFADMIPSITATAPAMGMTTPSTGFDKFAPAYKKELEKQAKGESETALPSFKEYSKEQYTKADIVNKQADPESWGYMVGSLAPQGAGIAAAVGVGAINPAAGMALGLANTGALSAMAAGGAAKEYDDYIAEKGIEVNPNDKLGSMMLSMAAESVSEAIPLAKFIPKGYKGKMSKFIFGNTEIASKKGAALIEEFANTNASRKQLVKNVLSSMGEGALTEGPTEAVAELGGEFSSWLYKEKEDRATWQEIAERAGKAVIGGSIMGAAIGPMSYGAQQIQNQRRRKESGKVVLAQDKTTGEAVEIMGIANPSKKEDGTSEGPAIYQAIRPNGKTVEIDENNVGSIVELPLEDFDGLLKGKGKAMQDQQIQKATEANQQQQTASDQARSQFEPLTYQGPEGSQMISGAKYNGEDVFITQQFPDGSAVIQKPGQEKQVVKFDALTEVDTKTFEDFISQNAPSPAQAGPSVSTEPIQIGESVSIGGKKYAVSSINEEEGIVQLENEEDGSDLPQLPLDQFNQLREESKAQQPVLAGQENGTPTAENPTEVSPAEQLRGLFPTEEQKKQLEANKKVSELMPGLRGEQEVANEILGNAPIAPVEEAIAPVEPVSAPVQEVEVQAKESIESEFKIEKSDKKWIVKGPKSNTVFDVKDSDLNEEMEENNLLIKRNKEEIERANKNWIENIVPKYGDREYNRLNQEAYSASQLKTSLEKTRKQLLLFDQYLKERLNQSNEPLAGTPPIESADIPAQPAEPIQAGEGQVIAPDVPAQPVGEGVDGEVQVGEPVNNPNKLDEPTLEQQFELNPATSTTDIDSNINEVLSQYSGKAMGKVQVFRYLTELGDLGKQWAKDKGITSKEDLDKWAEKAQTKARSGKGKERQGTKKENQKQITEFNVDQIEAMALKAENDFLNQPLTTPTNEGQPIKPSGQGGQANVQEVKNQEDSPQEVQGQEGILPTGGVTPVEPVKKPAPKKKPRKKTPEQIRRQEVVDREPSTPTGYARQWLLTGGKLKSIQSTENKDKGVGIGKGVRDETGMSGREMSQLIGIIDNKKGLSPEVAAERIHETLNEEMAARISVQDLRNALNDVILTEDRKQWVDNQDKETRDSSMDEYVEWAKGQLSPEALAEIDAEMQMEAYWENISANVDQLAKEYDEFVSSDEYQQYIEDIYGQFTESAEDGAYQTDSEEIDGAEPITRTDGIGTDGSRERQDADSPNPGNTGKAESKPAKGTGSNSGNDFLNLNPSGNFNQSLKAGKESLSKEQLAALEKKGNFLNQLMGSFPQLNVEHENEIFDLINSGKVLKEVDKLVSNKVNVIDFDRTKPLNLGGKANTPTVTKRGEIEVQIKSIQARSKALKDIQKVRPLTVGEKAELEAMTKEANRLQRAWENAQSKQEAAAPAQQEDLFAVPKAEPKPQPKPTTAKDLNEAIGKKNEEVKPSKSDQLSAEAQKKADELKNLFDDFFDAGKDKLQSGPINAEQIVIAGKIIGKASELGIVRFKQLIEWANQNMGADKMKQYFDSFKAAFGANLMINNPEKENINEIAASKFEDYLVEEKPVNKTKQEEVGVLTKEELQDVGEKIGGAKKDGIKKYFDKINLNGRILSNIFPKPDIKSLLDSGMTVKDVSAIKVAYEFAVQDKKRGPEVMKFYAAYAKSVLAESINLEFKNDRHVFTDYGKSQIELRSTAYEAVSKELGNEYLSLDLSKVRIRELTDREKSSIVDKTKIKDFEVKYYVSRGKYFDTKAEAMVEFVEQVKANTKVGAVEYKYKIGIYSSRIRDGRKNMLGYQPKGKPFITLKQGIETSTEARKYLEENEADLQLALTRILEEQKTETTGKPKVTLKLINETSRDRVGKDWRNGKDVSSKEFADTFGFRGVEFGNWVNIKERQAFVNATYDSLMDLAQLMNITPDAISLNKELAISFGSRGSGQASAHYEPGRKLINLTKTKGLGSLAHEWYHAVDNYFAGFGYDLSGMKAATLGKFKEGVRPEMKAAFDKIYQSLETGQFRTRSMRLDNKKNKDYYATKHEMAARAFENYVIARLTETGQINDFLANYVSTEDWRGEANMYPYPIGEETVVIREAFDQLTNTIQVDETDINRPMFMIVGEKGAKSLDQKEEATYRMDNLGVAREMETEGIQKYFDEYVKASNEIDRMNEAKDFDTDRESLEAAYEKMYLALGYNQYEANKDVHRAMKNAAKSNDISLLPKSQGNILIKQATGWERGADGKWRYEVADYLDAVSDNYALLGKRDGEVFVNASSLVTKEVNRAYPELDKILVQIKISPDEKERGSYFEFEINGKKSPPQISVFAKNKAEAQSILLHEIQHAIQGIEGFSRGSNAKDASLNQIKKIEKELSRINQEIIDLGEVRKTLKGEDWDKNVAKHKELVLERDALDDKKISFERDKAPGFMAYRRTSGEVEARNVQSRMNLSPEERRSTTLQSTEDVSREDQIFLESVKGPMNSMEESKSKPTTAADLNKLFSSERAQEMIETQRGPKQTKKSGEIEAKAAEFTKTWTNAPEIITLANAKEALNRFPELAAKYTEEDLNDVPAIFLKDPKTGKPVAVLIASHSYLSEKGGVEKAILHEVIGHYGIREFLKQQAKGDKAVYMKEFQAIMQQVFEAKKGEPLLADITKRYFNKPVSDLSQTEQWIVADEYLAHLAQSGVQDAWIDRIVTKLRQLLRKLGMNLGLSDSEIRNLLGNSMRIVRGPKGQPMVREGIDQTNLPREMIIGERGAQALDQSQEVTTRIDNLSTAREMEEAGKDPATIRLATGWERGADGKWRYETNDDITFFPAKKGHELNNKNKKMFTDDLSRVIDLPEVYASYPELKDYQISFVLGTDNYGSFNNSTKTILINALLNQMNQVSTILHEVQHAIQYIEGFARGGSPKLFKPVSDNIQLVAEEAYFIYMELDKEAKSNIKERWEEEGLGRQAMFNRNNVTTKNVDEILSILEQIEIVQEFTKEPIFTDLENQLLAILGKKDLKDVAFEKYQKLAGEVESRNVQKRLSLSPEERRTQTLQSTEDISRKDQIFLSGNQGEVMNMRQGQDQTSSHAFKAWFGDSKVVDENGKPLVVYHSTKKDFDSFKIKGLSKGYFFANHTFVNMTPRLFDTNRPYQDGSSIMPVYLSIKNPKIINDLSGNPYFENIEIEAAKKEGFDGLYLNESTWVAFEPTQIKSATGNNGEFDPDNADIRFMRTGATNADFSAVNTKNYGNAQLSWFERRVIEPLQDRMIRSKKLIQARTDGKVSDKADFYTQENLASGKTLEKARRFEKDLWNPLIQTANQLFNANGITPEEISDYLKFKHHGERKAYFIAEYEKLGKKIPKDDKWPTGMTDQEAADGISDFEAKADPKNLKKLNRQVKKVNQFTTFERYKSGMITKEVFKDLLTRYKNYVPLTDWKGMEATNDKVYTLLMSAKGRTSEAANPMPFMFTAAQEAIMRGENNRVRQSVLEFVKENVSPKNYFIRSAYYVNTKSPDEFGNDIWIETMNKPSDAQLQSGEAMRSFNPETHRNVQQQGELTNVLPVMVDGKKVFIEFTDKEIPSTIKNINQDQLPYILDKWRNFTRWLSSMYTQYSPEFGIRNLIRDVGFGTFNILVEQDATTATKTVKGMYGSAVALGKFFKNNEFPKGKRGEMLKEFMEEGSMTGYTDLQTAADVFARAKKEIERADKLNLWQAGGNTLAKPVEWAGKGLEIYNKMLENAMRFSYYQTLREAGVSKQQSAAKAKDLTVNFNRKGRASSVMGSLFIFFNASVQGSERLIRSFQNPKTRQKALGFGGMIMAAGLMQSLLYGLSDEEDEDGRTFYEKIPDYTRRNNIILPNFFTEDGNDFLKIPLPYGLNVFHSFGESLGQVLTGKKTIGEESLGMVSAMTNVFSPIGGIELGKDDSDGFYDVLSMTLPSVIQPVLDLGFNRNFAGRQIYRENFTSNQYQMPDSQMYFEGVNPIIKEATTFANKLTGGNEVIPGAVDINPEWIEHGMNQYLGGPAQFTQNLSNTVVAMSQGENVFKDPFLRSTPFVRSYVDKTGTDYQARQDYYEHRDNAIAAREAWEEMRQAGLEEDAAEWYQENQQLIMLAEEFKSYEKPVKTITKTINELKKIDKDQFDEDITKLLDERTVYMRGFNKRYGEVMFKNRPNPIKDLIKGK